MSNAGESSKGAFLGAKLTEVSASRLAAWMSRMDIPNPTPKDDLHCTVVYRETKNLPIEPLDYDPPVEASPETYEFKLFGPEKNCLVLAFASDELKHRHTSLRKKFNIPYKFPEYIPHVTLSYDCREIPKELPDFTLLFRGEEKSGFEPPAGSVMADHLNEGQWNEKDVVWEQGDYKIVVDRPGDATYVTLWTDDNKKVGFMSTRNLPYKLPYLGIGTIEIDKSARGKGLGHQMYRVLLKQMNPKWKGLASYRPDIANKRQVPRIHRRLGAHEWDQNSDIILIDRPLTEELMISDLMHRSMVGNKCQIIVEMPVMQFLELTTTSRASMDDIIDQAKSIEQYNHWARIGADKSYHDEVNAGKEGTPEYQHAMNLAPWLTIQLSEHPTLGRVVGHEGRHRAAAMMKSGNKTMKVYLCIRPAKNTLPDVRFGVEYHITSKHIPVAVEAQYNKYHKVMTTSWKVIEGDLQKGVRGE